MLRVSLTDLSRLPPEKLASLLLEWAERDRTLLARLHGTIADDVPSAHPSKSDSPKGESSRNGAKAVELVGDSPLMRHLGDMIDRFARTDEPVLITGESGTGKELAARAIHQRSSRADGPFAAVNCAAIPATLIASELFGHEKGAFTGAVARTRGQVEHAHGGTLFLDEIGDMPVELQGYLLRFLQEGQIVRVGGHQAIDVNVRIVAATNVRLRQAISEGRFREDLYYRLNVLALELPPLRDRTADIEELAWHFLTEAASHFGREVTGFEPEAMDVLRRYHWPGNVRELMSVVRRAVVIGHDRTIARSDLIGLEQLGGLETRGAGSLAPADTAQSTQVAASPRPVPGSPEERAVLLNVLAATGENIALTARELGVSRVTLYRMLRRHGVVPSRGFNAAPGIAAAELDQIAVQAHSDPRLADPRLADPRLAE
jgi:transcriptional regulator with PAS, ATPase and Fis domain